MTDDLKYTLKWVLDPNPTAKAPWASAKSSPKMDGVACKAKVLALLDELKCGTYTERGIEEINAAIAWVNAKEP